MKKQNLISTNDLAQLLGISHVAVFKKIKSGEIKAQKVGRNYVIDTTDLTDIFGFEVSKQREKNIKRVVDRVIKDYGHTLELLGEE